MKRKRIRICGRKTRTEPTPPQIPSTTRLRSGPSGSSRPTRSPDAPTARSTRSMRGAAALKIVWKTPTTTARKTSGPATGWRKRLSSRRVQTGGAGGRYFASAPRRAAHSRQRGRSFRAGSSTGRGMPIRPRRNWRIVSYPSPLAALMRATGAPRRRASSSTCTSPPRRSSSSAMFRTMSVGRPSARTGAARTRWRPRFVTSRMRRIVSGRGTPSIRPIRTSSVTRSSSERGFRL